MATIAITPEGPFSLDASGRFLEGFTPARYHGPAPDGAIRLAFPADNGHSTVGAAVRQAADGTVLADLTGDADPAAAQAQLARIFSLDIDGSGFAQVAEADPVVAGLAARYPGLRPVCFGSPYEAAAWAVIGHRIRSTQAAAIKERTAERHGEHLTVAGAPLAAFPTPRALRDLAGIPGLPEVKTERLRALADAALAGDLDAPRLRAMPPADALAHRVHLAGHRPVLRRAHPHPRRRASRPVPRPRTPAARRHGRRIPPRPPEPRPARRTQRPMGTLPKLGRPAAAHPPRRNHPRDRPRTNRNTPRLRRLPTRAYHPGPPLSTLRRRSQPEWMLPY
jgi:DNA-3-methyladenine glycosylase II